MAAATDRGCPGVVAEGSGGSGPGDQVAAAADGAGGGGGAGESGGSGGEQRRGVGARGGGKGIGDFWGFRSQIFIKLPPFFAE